MLELLQFELFIESGEKNAHSIREIDKTLVNRVLRGETPHDRSLIKREMFRKRTKYEISDGIRLNKTQSADLVERSKARSSLRALPSPPLQPPLSYLSHGLNSFAVARARRRNTRQVLNLRWVNPRARSDG